MVPTTPNLVSAIKRHSVLKSPGVINDMKTMIGDRLDQLDEEESSSSSDSDEDQPELNSGTQRTNNQLSVRSYGSPSANVVRS